MPVNCVLRPWLPWHPIDSCPSVGRLRQRERGRGSTQHKVSSVSSACRERSGCYELKHVTPKCFQEVHPPPPSFPTLALTRAADSRAFMFTDGQFLKWPGLLPLPLLHQRPDVGGRGLGGCGVSTGTIGPHRHRPPWRRPTPAFKRAPKQHKPSLGPCWAVVSWGTQGWMLAAYQCCFS